MSVTEFLNTRCVNFSSKCVWRLGSARTRYRSLQRSSRSLSWIWGRGSRWEVGVREHERGGVGHEEKGWREGEGKGEGAIDKANVT